MSSENEEMQEDCCTAGKTRGCRQSDPGSELVQVITHA